MTGALVVIASQSAAAFTITPANTGTGDGYLSSGTGSLSPASLRGVVIQQVRCFVAPASFRVRLAGVLSQGFISSIVVQNGINNAWHRFVSSSATFTTPGGTSSEWSWATDANGGATSDILVNGSVRPILIYV